MTKIQIVTHNGGFHADDVFGVATLQLLLPSNEIEVIRTRDSEIIASGDYVLDVGGVYDPETNRFDHHQEGGAGKRENGIPYASFGLIWKKFGPKICGSQEIADILDTYFVQTIDASDNGVSISTPVFEGVSEVSFSSAIGAFDVGTRDMEEKKKFFLEAVAWAQTFFEKKIEDIKAHEDMRKRVVDEYNKSPNKEFVIVHDEVGFYERHALSEILNSFPEPLFFIFKNISGYWQIGCVLKKKRTFESRKPLPKSWAGKRDTELAEITGVPDALFCHNFCFTAAAKSKEGALELARLALEV